MKWTAEDREKAIRISTDSEVCCGKCKHTTDDGWDLGCIPWCCGVGENEVCDEFESKI